jgi:hypothetical protein
LEGAKTQGEKDLALESRKRAKESMVKEKLAKANEKMETDNKQLRLEVSELLQWKKKSNIDVWNKHKWEKQRDNVMAELKQLQQVWPSRPPPPPPALPFFLICYLFSYVSFFPAVKGKGAANENK